MSVIGEMKEAYTNEPIKREVIDDLKSLVEKEVYKQILRSR